MGSNAWGLALGLGIGLLIGVMISSGIGFDRADGARFVGALLGSIIAVSGAVSLFFLQEYRERQSKLDQVEQLIAKTMRYGALTAKDKDADETEFEASLATYNHEWERLVRFCEKHEFGHQEIGEVLGNLASCNELRVSEILKSTAESLEWTPERRKMSVDLLNLHQRTLQLSLMSIREKNETRQT